MALNEKVLNRLLMDLKIRVQVEQLKRKRRDYTEKQKECETQDEVIFYMQEITKIDRELQQLKSNPL
jgi:hypothetical protein